MSVLTAEQSFAKIESSVEAIRSDEKQHFPVAASVGDVFQQGDVYIELLAGVPAGAVQDKKPSPQLAPGTTQGSRHILDSLAGIKVFRLPSPTVLDGPILDLSKERTVTHSEHGDCVLPPGVYGITYQRAFADELRRAAD